MAVSREWELDIKANSEQPHYHHRSESGDTASEMCCVIALLMSVPENKTAIDTVEAGFEVVA